MHTAPSAKSPLWKKLEARKTDNVEAQAQAEKLAQIRRELAEERETKRKRAEKRKYWRKIAEKRHFVELSTGKLETPLKCLAKEVENKFGVTLHELRDGGRYKKFMKSKRYFCFHACNSIGKSMPEVGQFLKCDHTTVLHHMRRFVELGEHDAD